MTAEQKSRIVGAYNALDALISTLKVSPNEGARLCQLLPVLAQEINAIEADEKPAKQPIENLKPIKGGK